MNHSTTTALTMNMTTTMVRIVAGVGALDLS